jgi:hypothetical protein
MKSALALGSLAISTATFVLLSAAVPATASAGGYVGAAVGTEPSVNDDFVSTVGQPTGHSLRGLVGWRWGTVSAEGALNGFTVLTNGFHEQTAAQLSAALRVNLPLGDGFEAFGRAGIERTWLNQSSDGFDLAGNGYLLGAGFVYKLDAVLANAAVFVDYNIHHVTLESLRYNIDATTGMWGLGLTIGF